MKMLACCELSLERVSGSIIKPGIRAIVSMAWGLLVCSLLVSQVIDATAQTFPEVSVSQQEITIPGDGTPVVINDVALRTPPLPAGFNTCLLTFNTELATSEEEQQLAVLFYATGADPSPERCTLEGVAGPILTQVNGGIDETHTFIGRTTIFVHRSQAPGTVTIRPCMSSALGGSYRLRTHLLTLQCGANRPALSAEESDDQVIQLDEAR
jgi:hypothetical protein